MPVVDLFSKRQKRARGEVPDIYVYEDLPKQLRVQIIHIIKDAFGDGSFYESNGHPQNYFQLVNQALCKEYGVFELVNKYSRSDSESIFAFFLEQESNLNKKKFNQIELDEIKNQYKVKASNERKDIKEFSEKLSNYIAGGDWRLYFLERDRIQGMTLEHLHRVSKSLLVPSNRTVGIFMEENNVNTSFIQTR